MRREKKLEKIKYRYGRNMAMENDALRALYDEDGHINGQGRCLICDMHFGPSIDEAYSNDRLRRRLRKLNDSLPTGSFGTVGVAGCEAIAVYNVLCDLGKAVPLSRVIYDIELSGAMLFHGWFGTKVHKLGDILRTYGVSVRRVRARAVQRRFERGEIREGDIFVISIKNDTDSIFGYGGGVHTFEAVYRSTADAFQPWCVYNRYNERSHPDRYSEFTDIPGEKGGFYAVYAVDR